MGRWCGIALFGPLATIVSNAIPSAPSSTMRGLQAAGDLPLGLPRRDAAEGLGQGAVADRAGLPEQRDLLVVLDRTQGLDRVAEGDELGRAVDRRQLTVGLHRDVVGLEREPKPAVAASAGHQGGGAGPVDDQLEIGRLVPRLGGVAPVGGQQGAVVR